MTETPQAPSESTAGKPSPRSSRLGQVAAVVGITAGVVFVVGAVFFFGLVPWLPLGASQRTADDAL